MTENEDAVAAVVRRSDPDRYFASLFAPAEVRPALMALYAFNHEIARIGESVSEPMLGEIRLQWWRETLVAAQKGASRNHETARALQLLLGSVSLPLEIVDTLMDARAFDFSPEYFETTLALEQYLDQTSGGLMRLAARILGEQQAPDSFARDAGIAYGLVGLLRAMPSHARRAKLFLPVDVLRDAGIDPGAAYAPENRDRLREVRRLFAARALAFHRSASRSGKPGKAIAAYLPAALVPLDVRHLKRAGMEADPARELPLYRRQLALLGAAIRGRI